MTICVLRDRPLRLFAVLCGGAGVGLLLGAAASPSVAAAPVRTAVVTGARAAASGGSWGPAKEVAAALNTGGTAGLNSVSCASAGNCGAGGFYTDGSGNLQAFAVSEVNGTWRPAIEVAASLNTLGVAAINSMSCASAGNCSAGGYYSNSRLQAAFVVNETNGTWGMAKEVAAALNAGRSARVESVSCASAGNCGAGGYYTDGSGRKQAFAVNEANGTWGPATEVAAALNTRADAAINSVSCPAAGNCNAGGYYNNTRNGMHGHSQAFVVSETNGTWHPAIEVAAALNTLRVGAVNSVSCPAAGKCSAGGNYTPSSGAQAFAVNEANGTWRSATEVAGALNTGGFAWLYSVSCPAAGNCGAGGFYTDNTVPRHQQAFAVNEASGTWGPAIEVAAALNTGGDAAINSVSCTAAGYCGAGGFYTGSSGQQAFAVSKP